MKTKMISFYMDICDRIAALSVAKRLQVGSLIVKDNNILAFGWNGTPAGWDNCCEEKVYDTSAESTYQLKTKPEVIHAESNAISKLARGTESGEGATMFITHAPCMDCAKLIYQSGISSVYYRNSYRDDSGVRFLKQSGIKVIQDDE